MSSPGFREDETACGDIADTDPEEVTLMNREAAEETADLTQAAQEEARVAFADMRGRLLRCEAPGSALKAGSGVVAAPAILRLAVATDKPGGGIRLRMAHGGCLMLDDSKAIRDTREPAFLISGKATSSNGLVFALDITDGCVTLTTEDMGGGRAVLIVGGDGRVALAPSGSTTLAAAKLTMLRDPIPGQTTARWALAKEAGGRTYALWAAGPARAWVGACPPPTKSLFGAVGGGTGHVAAQARALDSWECFKLEHADAAAGTVGLRSHHGRYVCAEPDGSLIADRVRRDAWETFVMEDVPDGGVTLRAEGAQPLRYISARTPARLDCRATVRGVDEIFMLFDGEAALAAMKKGNPEDGPPVADEGGFLSFGAMAAFAAGLGAGAIVGMAIAASAHADKGSDTEGLALEHNFRLASEKRLKGEASALDAEHVVPRAQALKKETTPDAALASVKREQQDAKDAAAKAMPRAQTPKTTEVATSPKQPNKREKQDVKDAAAKAMPQSRTPQTAAVAMSPKQPNKREPQNAKDAAAKAVPRARTPQNSAIAMPPNLHFEAAGPISIYIYQSRQRYCTKCQRTSHNTEACNAKSNAYGQKLSKADR